MNLVDDFECWAGIWLPSNELHHLLVRTAIACIQWKLLLERIVSTQNCFFLFIPASEKTECAQVTDPIVCTVFD